MYSKYYCHLLDRNLTMFTNLAFVIKLIDILLFPFFFNSESSSLITLLYNMFSCIYAQKIRCASDFFNNIVQIYVFLRDFIFKWA